MSILHDICELTAEVCHGKNKSAHLGLNFSTRSVGEALVTLGEVLLRAGLLGEALVTQRVALRSCCGVDFD